MTKWPSGLSANLIIRELLEAGFLGKLMHGRDHIICSLSRLCAEGPDGNHSGGLTMLIS